MEEALENELARLRDALARECGAQVVGQVGTWECDIARSEISWSSELYRIHGLVPGEALEPHEVGMGLVHPDDRGRVTEAVNKAIEKGEPLLVEYRVVRADGLVRHLQGRAVITKDAEGRPQKMTGTAADVTEFIAQRALVDARADFRALIDNLSVGVAIDRGARWVYANRALAAMLGASPDELVGRMAFEFLHPDDNAEVAACLQLFETGVVRSQSKERRFLRRDGQVMTAEVSSNHLADFEGGPALLLLVRDVTESKRLLKRQLLSERLLSVATLAAGVAHEVNNPLACVLSNIELIGEALGKLEGSQPLAVPREVLDMLAEARAGAERVREIVRGLQIFSSREDERRLAIDLRHALRTAIEMTHNQLRHHARLITDFQDVPLVPADEGRLAQVFINLLVNAAQSLPEGRSDGNEVRAQTFRDEKGWAVVRIADTGCGMAREVVPRIFEPFYTTKPVGVGTGLGLSICHGIVDSLGGQIDVESEPGKGTCITIRLPPSNADPPRAAAHVTPAAAALRAARILAIDDDAMIRRLLERILRDHQLTLVDSGRAALERLAEGATFDVILCDLMMPEMTGMELHAELARRVPQVAERMVFMTGGAFTAAARQFLNTVPNQRLDKPFDAKNLRAIVESFVLNSSE